MALVRPAPVTLALTTLIGAGAILLTGCVSLNDQPETASGPTSTPPSAAPTPATPPSASPTAPSSQAPSSQAPSTPASAEPLRSYVSVPALDLRDVPVVRYRGTPDDARGTRIQDADEMASPRGARGGVGPGEVGNFIVTGHRLTGAAPLRHAPSLRRGDEIVVRSGDTVHTYEVVRTRQTSFRSPASLAAQRAPVPGHPGQPATQAMLTLSTCATPEDHAKGNYWSDEFDNPEHRIDKIAVLRSSRPAS